MRARDNPFRVARLHHLRFRPQGTGWDEILARLRTLAFRAAIVGGEGCGKTTLLEELDRRLQEEGFSPHRVRVPRANGRPPALPPLFGFFDPGDLLLVDGADLLGPLARRALLRQARSAGGLVATTHRAGLLPTLVECRTSPRLLAELVEELLPERTAPSSEELEELWSRHRGNLRLALRELYDRWAAVRV